jgi:hypothetical protein
MLIPFRSSSNYHSEMEGREGMRGRGEERARHTT